MGYTDPVSVDNSAIKQIVYAADLGIFGPYLLAHVSELAQRHSARVTLVHAIEPISPFADAVVRTYLPDLAQNILDERSLSQVLDVIRQQVLETLKADLEDFSCSEDWLADVRVLSGRAAEVVLSEVERLKADMVVVGSHCRYDDPMSGNAIGNVATKILQCSPVPVYLVPTQTHRNRLRVSEPMQAR